MKGDIRAAVIVVLGLMALPGVAYALGTSSSDEATQPDLYKQAQTLIDDHSYDKAIPLLQKSIKEKGEYADALNLLGYANRKLGDKSKALTYYTKALNLEPNHLGANEYLGELYLEMNDLPKAEERLGLLKKLCGSCEEYDDLAEQVESYKTAHGQS